MQKRFERLSENCPKKKSSRREEDFLWGQFEEDFIYSEIF